MKTFVVASLLIASTASAERAILIESYAESRPLGMTRVMARVSNAMGNALGGDELRARIEENHSRPAGRATADEIQTLQKRLVEGMNAYAAGNFAGAVAQL